VRSQTTIIIAAIAAVTSGLLIFANPRARSDTTLVEPIPPPEFVPGEHHQNTAASVNLPAAMSERPYDFLDENEKRALFRAVIYTCNETENEEGCATYLRYCGNRCRVLVKVR
jgi:hypothetical protein